MTKKILPYIQGADLLHSNLDHRLGLRNPRAEIDELEEEKIAFELHDVMYGIPVPGKSKKRKANAVSRSVKVHDGKVKRVRRSRRGRR